MPSATLAALTVYPVKACRGIALDTATAAIRGLVAAREGFAVGDREWMIVDCDGRFITQRDHPRLALIETRVTGGNVMLATTGRSALAIPIEASTAAPREVVVWQSRVLAHDAGNGAAQWLSAFLGIDVRLVRFDPAQQRLCNKTYVGESGAHTAFADGYPVLVIGTSSLGELNQRLVGKGAVPIPMNRFRPNIVLEGLEPYDEDHLDTIIIDGVMLKAVKPCTRCQVPTTNQETAEVGTEPLLELAAYRMNAALGGVTFGMNAIVVSGVGHELKVGATADCSFAF
jgi:uncharacterized protein YcbX